MRISIFCGGTYVSGMEINTVNLIRGLRDRGHNVRVLANGWNDGDFVSRLEANQIPFDLAYLGKLTRRLRPREMWWMANTLFRLPSGLLATRRHLRAFDPHVVLLFNRDTALLTAPLLRRLVCVFHVAEFPAARTSAVRPYLMLDRWIAGWVAVSNYVAEAMRESGVSDEKVSVVYNGISEAVIASRNERSDVPRIGVCGQIGSWKGHEDLLAAASLLSARGCRFRLLVFGTGDAEHVARLKELVVKGGIAEPVEWRGFVRDLASMYAQIDILAVPSRVQEAFGLVAAEAGLNSIPVVATRRGGLPEIVIDGETGFLVDAESPEQLADRLLRLLESEDLRISMGRAASERVGKEFTVDRMAAGHERRFAALVSERA
jgi:glycosyltransferase involved in cell wall biosynthesis